MLPQPVRPARSDEHHPCSTDLSPGPVLHCTTMSAFTVWPRFGFSANPYSQETLQADKTGSRLIAGRDADIQSLQFAIGSGGAHASVEGPIGAGKTSMINVAVYRMQAECLRARDRELYLPAVTTLQPRQDAEEFVQNAFRTIAQTLIRFEGQFTEVGLNAPNVGDIDRWLNRAQYESRGGGLQALGFGADASWGSEANTSAGFAQSGFEANVRAELERVYANGSGAIVCILDNLEILESPGRARAALDELRDRVLNVKGVRWVLCGSRGIVSRARTERLSGVIQSPLVVQPLNPDAAVEAIRKRIEYYGDSRSSAPVTPAGFELIYQALHHNLRDSMERAQKFSFWISDRFVSAGENIPSESDRNQLVQKWLLEEAEVAFRDARGVQPRVWQFFGLLAERGGRAGSREYVDYGFNNQQQFTASITALSEVNLVTREIDPENGARTINSVTALGWLVYYHRRMLDVPQA